MSTNYKDYTIPGTDITIKIRADEDGAASLSSQSKTPEWMVKCGDKFTSMITGYTDYIELLGFYGETFRNTTGQSSMSMPSFNGSSSIGHTQVALVIPMGGHITFLETSVGNNPHINDIVILRIGNIMGATVIMQKITFTGVILNAVQQDLDGKVSLRMQIGSRTNEVASYGMDGAALGQLVSKTDYNQNIIQ